MLSAQELAALPEEQRGPLRARAEAPLPAAGARWVIESVVELPALLPMIDAALARGETPGRPGTWSRNCNRSVTELTPAPWESGAGGMSRPVLP